MSVFPESLRDERMATHTYLKIGGPARLYLTAEKSEDVIRAIRIARQYDIPWYVFGGGSNMLVSDDGFEGIMIHVFERSHTINGDSATATSGVFTGLLARAMANAGLEGFEWGIGVPGTIGGAIYGNAGCFGGEMKDVVERVEAYDVARDEIVEYATADCRFGYRDSRFKHEPHVILRATLRAHHGDAAVAVKKLEDIVAKRKESQPQGAFSAGCLFKNFEYTDESAVSLLQQHVDAIPEPMLQSKRIPAGWLIDRLGLKGTTVGRAQVSPVHGNFLVNLGGASAADVIGLASLVKMKVRDAYGILLEDEVQFVGF